MADHIGYYPIFDLSRVHRNADGTQASKAIRRFVEPFSTRPSDVPLRLKDEWRTMRFFSLASRFAEFDGRRTRGA